MTETMEFDVEAANEQAKQEYKDQTGETLPDHVLENLDLLQGAGPSIDDMHEYEQNVRKAYGRDSSALSKRDLSLVWLAIVIAVSAAAYGSGLALAGNAGMAVVALVSVAFGFAVATLLS